MGVEALISWRGGNGNVHVDHLARHWEWGECSMNGRRDNPKSSFKLQRFVTKEVIQSVGAKARCPVFGSLLFHLLICAALGKWLKVHV